MADVGKGYGRSDRRDREQRAAMLAANSICWLCGLPGADTIDHEPPRKVLLERGLDPRDPKYWRPAHGKKIPGLCEGNFARGVNPPKVMRRPSRKWL